MTQQPYFIIYNDKRQAYQVWVAGEPTCHVPDIRGLIEFLQLQYKINPETKELHFLHKARDIESIVTKALEEK